VGFSAYGTTTTTNFTWQNQYTSSSGGPNSGSGAGAGSGGSWSTWSSHDHSITQITSHSNSTDTSGSTHVITSTLTDVEDLTASGMGGPSGTTINYTLESIVDSTTSDSATNGNQSFTVGGTSHYDWVRSGNLSPSGAIRSFSLSANGNGSLGDAVVPTDTDNTTLNDSASNAYVLTASGSQGAPGGATSSFNLTASGAENHNLATSTQQARSGNGDSGGDGSSFTENTTDVYNLTDGGGTGPGGNFGSYTLTANGTDNATQGMFGGGSNSNGAGDDYHLNDVHNSNFNLTDSGTIGINPTFLFVLTTHDDDHNTTHGAGVTIRTGSGGTGSDNYSLDGSASSVQDSVVPKLACRPTISQAHNPHPFR